jgi:membrane protein
MAPRTLPSIPWTELVRRTVRDTIDDDCLGLAAQLSYYLCLALFPALLFLLALSSFFSLHTLTDDVAAALGPFVSSEILSLIQEQMRRLAEANDLDLRHRRTSDAVQHVQDLALAAADVGRC